MLSCHPVGSSPGFTASQSSKNLSEHCSGSGRMIVSGSNSDWSDQIIRSLSFMCFSFEVSRVASTIDKHLWGTESHRLTHSCFKGRSDFTQTGGLPGKSSGKEGWEERWCFNVVHIFQRWLHHASQTSRHHFGRWHTLLRGFEDGWGPWSTGRTLTVSPSGMLVFDTEEDLEGLDVSPDEASWY